MDEVAQNCQQSEITNTLSHYRSYCYCYCCAIVAGHNSTIFMGIFSCYSVLAPSLQLDLAVAYLREYLRRDADELATRAAEIQRLLYHVRVKALLLVLELFQFECA